ncbi:MAG: VTT domain-containing protein [Anaerolineales bacterium]
MADNTVPVSAAPKAKRQPVSWRLQLARAGALLLVVLLTFFIYSIRDQAQTLARFGYPGIFLLSLMAYATVILPAPGLTIVFAAGTLPALSPLGIALAAGAGATLGELSGYLAGFSGQAAIENRGMYDRLTNWMKRYGPLTIAVLAFIPSPFFDLAGIAAGALKMPVPRFLLWCAVGQTLKMLVVAYAGSYSIDWLTQLLK